MNNRIKELRYVKASELAPDPRNPRRHPAAQRAALQAMLAEVGIADAVIARETAHGLVLIDGHLRADLDPDQMLPVLVTDLGEVEAGKVLATLDPLAAMAEVDGDALARLIAEAAPPVDLKAMFSDVDLAAILAPELLTDPDDAPEPPEEPVTQRGDVWTLGRHRLMCGDSQDEADVDKLLDGATPRLMVTDPPYGVNYDADWRNRSRDVGDFQGVVGSHKITRSNIGSVANDDMVDWHIALSRSPSLVAYVWTASLHVVETASILSSLGLEIRALLIWRKPSIAVSRGHYHWQHEPLWYAVRKGSTAGWIGDRSQSTIWDIAGLNPMGRSSSEMDKASGHSTQKPVECMERPIRNHDGDVYDPFVGSGTTIIAAERQSRACWAMELEPKYVDAAVKRWEDYTGGKATRVKGDTR